MRDLDRLRNVGALDHHGNRLFAPWVRGLLNVRAQLNQEKTRLAHMRTAMSNFR